MKVAILGGGSWGTALADLLAGNNVQAALWVRRPEQADAMRGTRENPDYLPGVRLHPELSIFHEPEPVLQGADYLLMAVPSQTMGRVLRSIKSLLAPEPGIICASKGIELDTLCTMSQVVERELEGLNPRYSMLSGPTFAAEVARGLPSAIVLGCAHEAMGKEVQTLFSTDTFRVYTNPDYRGVELGGAVKNVIAIAAGIADGLSFGHNARAALITRGLAEISRLGKAMGANSSTFMGLAGMGDLVLTCTGDLSRNRQVGLKLGQGQKLPDIISAMNMVAEGVKTTESVHALGNGFKVELPITQQVFEVLTRHKDPSRAVQDLMGRELKKE